MKNRRLFEYALSLGLFLLMLFGPAWTVPADQGEAVAVFGVT